MAVTPYDIGMSCSTGTELGDSDVLQDILQGEGQGEGGYTTGVSR